MADGLNKALGTVIGAASQGNIILAGIVQGIALYRQARAAWKAAHPDPPAEGEPSPAWLEDEQLIDLLQQDSDALVLKANDLLAKYAAAEPPPVEG